MQILFVYTTLPPFPCINIIAYKDGGFGNKMKNQLAPGISRGNKDASYDFSPLKVGERPVSEVLRPPFSGLDIASITITHGLRRGLRSWITAVKK